MAKWEPIETAPMDVAILVHNNDAPGLPSGHPEKCSNIDTVVAAWWPDENDGKGAWICYMSLALDPECPFEPTHWMPLPDPPEEE